MTPKKEQLEAYKAMAKESAGADMKSQIRENLLNTCDKFAGNENRLDDCLAYLTNCAREILDGENGDVPDEICFRICRDYFNDELWKEEEEKNARKAASVAQKKAEIETLKEAKKAETARRKAEALAKKQAEAEAKKKAEKAKAKKKAAEAKKAAAEARKAEIARKKAEALARKKAEEEAKKAELERMKAEAAREAKAAEEQKKTEEARKADLCSGQMDFFALMGC